MAPNPSTNVDTSNLGITPVPAAGGGSAGTPSVLGGFDPKTYNPTHVPGGAPWHDARDSYQKQPTTPYGTPAAGVFFVSGDEWAPQQDVTNIPTVQAELVAAGLLSAKGYTPGIWDVRSANAYKQLLTFANASQMAVPDAFKHMIENRAQMAAKSQAAAARAKPGPYTTSNPVDTRAAYQTAAQQIVGQNLPASEAQKFAAYYQTQEQNAYAALAKGIGAGTLTTVGAPTAANAAEDYIRQNDPAQALAYGMASRAMDFQHLLGSATGL